MWNCFFYQLDVDECQQQEGGMCTKDNEKCVNTMGSFECECIVGYKRNADTFECEEEGITRFLKEKKNIVILPNSNFDSHFPF